MLQVASPGALASSSPPRLLRTTRTLAVGSAAAVREAADLILIAPGRDLVVADTAADAEARLSTGEVDLLLVDLAASEGLQFLRRQAGRRARTPILCIADRRRPDASAEALRLGALDIIPRPVRAQDLAAAMSNAGELARVVRGGDPVADSPAQPHGIIAASAAMRDVLGIVQRVATSRCGVLIAGERGTGREMIARAIHAEGPRRGKPFIKIACADSQSADLGGILTGALPAGATVYLDDVGELLPEAQAQLEAALDREHGVDHAPGAPADPDAPRFITSALPSTFEAVLRDTVRRRLLESLAVVRIDLPPLRQRRADIPLLALHFLKEACRCSDRPPKTFSRTALTLLAALPWHGNAVELRSLTESLAVLVPRGLVLLEDVLANVRLDYAEALGGSRETLRGARERFERDFIISALQHRRGRMAEAAADLGIERTNLYRKIRQLNIRWVLPE